MKAIPLGDKIRLVAENESDNAVIKLVTRNLNVAMLSNSVESKADGTRIESLTIGAGPERRNHGTSDSTTNDPYDRLTIAEAVRHVHVAEQTINALLKQLRDTTGMRIEVEVTQPEFGPPIVGLGARAR